MSLSDLKLGQSGTITKIDLSGLTKQRIMDMGFVIGSIVTKSQKGLFNDPIVYIVKNTTIALRNNTAKHIILDPVPMDDHFISQNI